MNPLPSNHPNPNTLKAFGLGRLDNAGMQTVSDHLTTCDDCRRAVAQASGDSFTDRLRASQQPADPAAWGGSSATLPPELADHPEYEVVKELGRGGMGVVYLARNRELGRMEVLKVMGREVMDRPGAADRFQAEAQAAARLSHPNIVTVFAIRRLGRLLVFAMEYVEGEDLHKVVEAGGPLPVRNACYYAYHAALGLQHAHEHGMAHRDIKPHNLILHKAGKKHAVKILDFGLAKVPAARPADPGLTREGQPLGTPSYMSPEQIQDARTADTRSDIYALGCTLYFLLAGRPPFEADSLYALLAQHVGVEAVPLHQLRADIPPELSAVVARMMAKDPAARFQTPAEVAQALAPYFRAGGASASATVPAVAANASSSSPQVWASFADMPAPPPSAAPPPARRSRAGLWAAVAAVGFCAVAALATVIYVATDNGTIRIELSDPSARVEVRVDGGTVDVSGAGGPLKLRAGDHGLLVTGDGFETESRSFTVRRGGNPALRVELTPKKPPAKVVAEEPPPTVPDASGKFRRPDPRRLEAAKAKVLSAHAAELAVAKPEDRPKVARALVEKAAKVPDTQIDQGYALLEVAAEVAAEAGDFDAAGDAFREIEKRFAVDPFAVKAGLMKGVSVRMLYRGEAGPLENLAEVALRTGFEAIAADRYAEAKTLAAVAGPAAAKAEAPQLVYQAAFLGDEVARVGGWYDRVRGSLPPAGGRPADPKARAEVGAFFCLGKGDWGRGLELLADCGDPGLAALAAGEAKKPTTGADRVALGDLWWAAADKVAAPADTDFRRRARHWYLKGLAATPADDRPALAERVLPRVDRVPTRPVTVRLRFKLWGSQHLRLSADGLTHTGSHSGWAHVNQLHLHPRDARENAGANRLLPDGTDFTTADVVREWVGGPATMGFRFGIDAFEVFTLNSTGNGAWADLTVTFGANGFAAPNRLSGLWDVKYYKLTGGPGALPGNWDAAVAAPPAVRQTQDRFDFAGCGHNPFSARQPPPVGGIPHDWFGIVATSGWETPAGRYEVDVRSDDGIRVFVDDKKVIDSWKPQGATPFRAEMPLTAGAHRVRVEYYQADRGARLQFALRRLGD